MRLLPRSPRETWLLAAATWVGLCAAAWFVTPPRPRLTLSTDGPHLPLRFSPDGQVLVTYKVVGPGKPRETRFWDTASGQRLTKPPELNAYEDGAYFSPDGRWLVFHADTLGYKTQYLIWDRTRSEYAAKLIGQIGDERLFSPDGNLLAVASDPTRVKLGVRLLEMPSLKVRAELPNQSGGPLAFSPDGRYLAVYTFRPDGSSPESIAVWDAATIRQIAGFSIKGMPAQQLTLTDDVLLTHSFEGNDVIAWDVATGQKRYVLKDEPVIAIEGDDLLLTSTQSNKGLGVRARDLRTGAVRYELAENLDAVAEGGRLVTMEYAMTTWDRARGWLGRHGMQLWRHQLLLPTVRVHDARTGRQLGPAIQGGQRLALAPDGRTLAILTDADRTQVWDVPWQRDWRWFAVAAGLLALPIAWLSRQRVRRLAAKTSFQCHMQQSA